ncbi:MAG: isoprenylcysteine carboxylmethyltransferase family protein [Opitutae bacterium]|nr:isoprenylcysteine carboxylmethyltransferase family protein [Opitutae bacterium]
MRFLELKIPPVALGLLLTGLMWTTARLTPFCEFRLPAGPALAAGLMLAGAGIAVAGVVSFRRAKTTVNPLAPATASALVVTGIYRRTRNPMYLGMLLVLLSGAVLLANALSLVWATAFIPLMNRLQIGPEEKVLAAKFGAGFAAYRAQVRRWC